MTTREELIEAGFNKYEQGENFPPIYWKREEEMVEVYYQTDGGAVVQSFHGRPNQNIEDKIMEWERALRGGWD